MVTTKKKTIINIRGGLNLNKDLCKHYILNDLQKDIFKISLDFKFFLGFVSLWMKI